MSTTLLGHEALKPYNRNVGGEAGKGTHGGEHVDRPSGMPTKEECTHVVDNAGDLVSAVQVQGARVYLDYESTDRINLGNFSSVKVADGVEVVGQYCDPDVPGRGVVLIQPNFKRHTFVYRGSEAPTLWGVSFAGPILDEDPIDLDHKSQEFKDKLASGFWVYGGTSFTAMGCEFRGWSCAGVEVGSKDSETLGRFYRCTFTDNQFEHAGYGVETYNGHSYYYRCFFNSSRHGITAYGHDNNSWYAEECLIGGNGWMGHAFDVHGRGGKHSDGRPIAGKFVRMVRCTSLVKDDVGGYLQETLAIRGRSHRQSYAEDCHFRRQSKPEEPGEQGSAVRQEVTEGQPGDGGYENFHLSGNLYKNHSPYPGKGVPLKEKVEKPSKDKDETEKDDPSGQPSGDKDVILEIQGQDVPAEYEARIRGDAQKHTRNEKEEYIDDVGDGIVKIGGYVGPGSDKFKLSDDAEVLSFAASGKVRVYQGGKELDLGQLALPAMWNYMKSNSGGVGPGEGGGTSDLQALRKRVADIESIIDSLGEALK